MLNEQVWSEEQARLEQVAAQLRERVAELEPELSGLHAQVSEIRRHFWEDVSVDTGGNEEFEETFLSIKQQEAILSERERSHLLRVRQWKALNRLLQSPYFGRIDFREDGVPYTEQVYVGVSSFADDDGLNFLIYDWRTPIAGMYYDHSPGAAGFDTRDGRVEGIMTLKRQYRTHGDRLLNVFDTTLTIGDELLQQVLGKEADARMQSIVATIQKEQNEIIRDDRSRMLIVQGAAGSGKTSAALQRVAYLLYKHRDRLGADQIVLFSPNPLFNSYVSNVLPELGEENMQQTTFHEYIDHWLGRTFKLEEPFEQIEYALTGSSASGYEARLAGIRYKSSLAFLHALQNYERWLGGEGMRFTDLRFRGRPLITAEQMQIRFYGLDPAVRLANRVELLQQWLLQQLTRLEQSEREADWVREELDYLDSEQYAEAFAELHKERGVFEFAEQYEQIQELLQRKERRDEADFDYAEQEENLLARKLVRAQFEPLRKTVKRLRFIDTSGIYAQLFQGGAAAYRRMAGEEADAPERWEEICAQTRAKLERGELFNEDATPYLFLKERIEGLRTSTEVRHVFIDEGQDYSIFQYAFLKKLFPRARMTVLGDFNQAIFAQATDLRDPASPLFGLYGESATKLYRLVRSYRSTREIAAFTKALLPAAGEIVPFDRSGGKPLLIRLESRARLAERLTKDIAALREEGFASIAVLTKTAAQSREAYELLAAAGCESALLVAADTPDLAQGVQIMPVYLAKGLEFEAVCIYEASAQTYGNESERKLFYTACTRAMHRLRLYAAGEWTPFLDTVDASLFEDEILMNYA